MGDGASDEPIVLVIARGWPTRAHPAGGAFVRDEVAALSADGLRVEVIAEPEGSPPTAYFKMWLRMRRALRGRHIAVVHAHYGWCGWVGRLQLKAPVVVTFHGGDLLGSRGMQSGRPTLRGYLEAWLSRRLARLVDVPVVVSSRMAAAAGPRAVVIPAGVDSATFRVRSRAKARLALDLDGEMPVVLFAADPERQVKRFALADAAVQELRKLGLRAQLITTASETRENMALWMAAADVLLLTSESEGSPLVVREALASGLPVVSVDVGDVRERLEKYELCGIAEPKPEALAQELLRVIASNGRVEADAIDIWGTSLALRRLRYAYARVGLPDTK